MSNKKFNKNDIINIVYRLMYVIPISLAIIAECRVWVDGLLKKEEYASWASTTAAQGAVYAGMVLLSLLAAFLISLVVTLTKWTKLAGGVGVIATMLVMMFMHIIPERLTVSTLLWLVPVVLADIIRCFAKKEAECRVVFLLPFLIISFFMINFIPISAKPLDWSGVVKAYERIVENSKEFWSRFEWAGYNYETAQIGFDGNGSLFKKLNSNNDVVMEVTREYPTAGATYIVGKIYTDFNGTNWAERVSVPGETEYTRMMDTIETRSAIEETYPYNMREVYSSVKVDISIKDMRTPYVLTPNKMIVGARNSINVNFAGDNILFDDTKTYGYEYSVFYYMLNRNGEDLIKYHREITEETWKTVSINHRPNGGTPYTYEEYLDYRRQVKEIYGVDPQLSDETKALIDEITAGAETDYEKMCLIENWLASQIYSLDVDTKGKGIHNSSDFMDYFLFEDTRGYCSYYATAFVLMARELGLPARFVQGYRIPSSNMNTIVVSSNMAHAWPEVYFEGVGWIRFEPTPGYGSVPSWGSPLREPEYYEELALQEEAEQEKYTEDDSAMEEVVEEVPYYDDTKRLEEEARIKEETKRRQQIITVVAIATFGGLLLAALLFVSIRLITRSVKYRHLSKDEKRIEMCLRCMLVLDSMGRHPEQGETLSEYGKRVAEELGIENLTFIDAYENILYRNGSDIKVSVLVDNYEQIKKLLKGRKRIKARMLYAFAVLFNKRALG